MENQVAASENEEGGMDGGADMDSLDSQLKMLETGEKGREVDTDICSNI
jgi:hypothetical protein